MTRFRFFAVAVPLALSACGGATSTPELFALQEETKVALNVVSATRTGGSVASSTYTAGSGEQFWIKSSEVGTRVLRYGRPGSGTPASADVRRHNYIIPYTAGTENGQTVFRGTLNVTDRASLPTGTASRVFDLVEIKLPAALAGIVDVTETGSNLAGTDTHAYAGGIPAAGLPANATYSGHLFGSFLQAGSATDYDNSVALTVDFSGGTLTGNVGSDMSLSGTVTGANFSGTATVTSGSLLITNGTAGTFDGSVYGDGAPNAAGVVAISQSGPDTEFVGAFGASAN